MVKELDDFKVGDRVQINQECRSSGTGTLLTKGLLGRIEDPKDEGGYGFRTDEGRYYAVHQTYLSLVVDVTVGEPDYHVYPDTPVGTELVVIRDTKTKMGRFIHKGVIVVLYASEYTRDGAYRTCTLPDGSRPCIDCDDLMIKGYPLN